MAFPTLTYDADLGTNTAASGAGPTTALTGASATSVEGQPFQINLAGSELTTVATDGSHVLFMQNANGARHLTRILGKSGTIVTVEDSFSVSDAAWAIGGKRKGFNRDSTRRDWADWKAGWTVSLLGGTYLSPVTMVLPNGDQTSGPFTIKRDAEAASNPVIQASATGITPLIELHDRCHIYDIDIRTQFYGTGAAIGAGTGSARAVHLRGLDIREFDFGIKLSTNELSGEIRTCLVDSCPSVGIGGTLGVFGSLLIIGCTIGGCGDGIVLHGSGEHGMAVIRNNLITNHVSDAVVLNVALSPAGYIVDGNTIDCCIGDGIRLELGGAGTPNDEGWVVIQNNILTQINGTALKAESAAAAKSVLEANYNGFWSNPTNYANIAAGANDVLASTDPYVEKAVGNLALNATSTGGGAFRSRGFPAAFPIAFAPLPPG